jgi:DEAD/DEAH box helicase domain-containing protein
MHQKYGCNAMAALEKGTSFEWLMHYLANPSATTWQQWGLLRTLAQANASSFTDSSLQSQWSQQIQTLLGDLALDYWGPPAQFISGDVPVSSVLRIWHAADLTRHAQLDPTGSLVVIQLDDLPADHLDPLKHSWNEALRLLNLYQFLPHVYAITTTAINQGQQPLLADPPVSQKQPASAVTAADQGWVDLRSAVLDEDLLVALDQMEQESWPRPEVGYELANERGKVIAEAELAWPGAKVAVLLTDDDQDVWAQAGWCAFTVDQFASAMGTIKDRLPGA